MPTNRTNGVPWERLPYEEIEARASALETRTDLPEDVLDAVRYWRSCRVGMQRAALQALELASARGVLR